jgi:ribosome-associated toxin RatA of RatAB toxin-antitoxin module
MEMREFDGDYVRLGGGWCRESQIGIDGLALERSMGSSEFAGGFLMRSVLTFFVMMWSCAAWADFLPPEGLVIEGLPETGSARGVKAAGIIRYHPEFVWRVLTDYPAFPEYMPNIRESRVTKQEGNVSWVASKFNVSVKNLNYVLRIVHERDTKPWKISWTRDSGDMKLIEGYYLLQEVPGGTRLEHVSKVDTGSFMPGFIQEALTKRSLPELYRAIAERAAMHESKETRSR